MSDEQSTTINRRRALTLLALGLPAATLFAQQGWPERPVKVIIPGAPAGSTDVLGRPLALGLEKKFGRPFIIDYKAGAGGLIGTDLVAKSPADGYTLLISAAHVSSAAVRITPYDPIKDFEPLAIIATGPGICVVPVASPYKTIADLVSTAKASPGKLNFGSAGFGDLTHLAGEAFCKTAGVQMVHVPHKGIAPALIELAAGRVDVIFSSPASVKALVDAEQLRLLAVTSPDHLASNPGLPTVKESLGVDFDMSGIWIILAPAGIPVSLRDRLNAAVVEIVNSPSYAPALAASGGQAGKWNGPQTREKMRAEIERLRAIAEAAGVKPTA